MDAYFNWDKRAHRQAILHEQWPPETQVIVFDEIHKYPRWKTFIKGLWDTRRQRERFERIFREDIRETEMVRSLSQVELLAGLLPHRVGSPLSIKSLAEDVEASPKTIQAWLDLLARNYYKLKLNVQQCFLVTLEVGEDYEDRRTGVRVIPAARFLMALVKTNQKYLKYFWL